MASDKHRPMKRHLDIEWTLMRGEWSYRKRKGSLRRSSPKDEVFLRLGAGKWIRQFSEQLFDATYDFIPSKGEIPFNRFLDHTVLHA